MKKKLIVSALITSIALIISTISTSLSWFVSITNIVTNDSETGIQGSILNSYFDEDSGNGIDTGPLIITRPKHWQNLIYLHNNQPDFYRALNENSETGFKFQIGKKMTASSSTYEVYDYNEYGYANLDASGNEKTSRTLNLSCYGTNNKGLIPIGSPEYPYISEMEGYGITVANFKVISTDPYHDDHALEDIGVFGYVGGNGKCNNVYFSNFTIDTTGANLVDNSSFEEHKSHDNSAALGTHNNYPFVGYIAGHIVDANNFTNVYVNKCTIDGHCNTIAQTTNYGYYGAVEEYTDNPESSSGGNNYSFKLDSSAIHEYFENNYDSIKGNPIRARNTEYENDVIHGDSEYNRNSSTGEWEAVTPFSNGVKYVTSGANTYNLQGEDPDSAYYGTHNYSISTLGYAEPDNEKKDLEYTVKAKDSAGNLTNPTQNMQLADKSLADQLSYRGTARETKQGEYYYYDQDNGKYEYYNLHTYDRYKVPFKLKVRSSGSHNFGTTLTQKPEFNASSCFVVLFIDDQKGTLSTEGQNVSNIKLTYDTNKILGAHYYTNPTLSFTYSMDLNLELSMGTHYIGAIMWCSFSNTQMSNVYCHYGDSLSQSYSALTVTMSEFVIDNSNADNFEKEITFNFAKDMHHIQGSKYQTSNCQAANSTTFNENSRPLTIYNDCDTVAKTLVGIDEKGNQVVLSSANYEFLWKEATYKYVPGAQIFWPEDQKDDQGNIIYKKGDPVLDEDGEPTFEEGTYVVDEPAHWIAKLSRDMGVKIGTDGNPIVHYISDLDVIRNSGYDPKNIDIVGGGFRFSSNYITIDGEDDESMVDALVSDDVGDPFYATKYGTNSIVLRLTNVGGKYNNSEIGTIKFYYSWTFANILDRDFKSMCFKKGNSEYLYFEDVTDEDDYDEPEQDSIFDKEVSMVLRKGAVKKAAYCALDKNGNILCGFDNDGNPTFNTGVKDSQIDSYILLVGVKNNAGPFNIFGREVSINTRVSKIEFEYRARGSGGDFGSVEYRSASDTSTKTIFKLAFICPKNDDYRTYVEYTSSTQTYLVKLYYYSSTTNATLEINYYVLDSNYKVSFVFYDGDTNQNTTKEVTSSGYLVLGSTAKDTWTS